MAVNVENATRGPGVQEEFRRANERIARSAARLHFVSRVPFICECSDGECRELVLLRMDEYHAAREGGGYITLAGHRADA